MKFVYGKQDMVNASRSQENCWLLGNGLGGFSSSFSLFQKLLHIFSLLL